MQLEYKQWTLHNYRRSLKALILQTRSGVVNFPVTSFSSKGPHAADLSPSNTGVTVYKLFRKQEMYRMSAFNPGSGLETQNSESMLRAVAHCSGKHWFRATCCIQDSLLMAFVFPKGN